VTGELFGATSLSLGQLFFI